MLMNSTYFKVFFQERILFITDCKNLSFLLIKMNGINFREGGGKSFTYSVHLRNPNISGTKKKKKGHLSFVFPSYKCI